MSFRERERHSGDPDVDPSAYEKQVKAKNGGDIPLWVDKPVRRKPTFEDTVARKFNANPVYMEERDKEKPKFVKGFVEIINNEETVDSWKSFVIYKVVAKSYDLYSKLDLYKAEKYVKSGKFYFHRLAVNVKTKTAYYVNKGIIIIVQF